MAEELSHTGSESNKLQAEVAALKQRLEESIAEANQLATQAKSEREQAAEARNAARLLKEELMRVEKERERDKEEKEKEKNIEKEKQKEREPQQFFSALLEPQPATPTAPVTGVQARAATPSVCTFVFHL